MISLNSKYLVKDDKVQERNAMLSWLRKELSFETKWKIVYLHYPLYCSHDLNNIKSPCVRDAKTQREHLESIFTEFGVQLVISGHDHTYDHTRPIIKQGIKSPQGFEGTVYLTCGTAGYRSGHYTDSDEFIKDKKIDLKMMETELNMNEMELKLKQMEMKMQRMKNNLKRMDMKKKGVNLQKEIDINILDGKANEGGHEEINMEGLETNSEDLLGLKKMEVEKAEIENIEEKIKTKKLDMKNVEDLKMMDIQKLQEEYEKNKSFNIYVKRFLKATGYCELDINSEKIAVRFNGIDYESGDVDQQESKEFTELDYFEIKNYR
jgi:hypothetical protein